MNIENFKKEELKNYCRKNKIKGYSRKKKNEIIELIMNHNNNNNIPEAPFLDRNLFKPYNLSVKVKYKFKDLNDYIKWINNFNNKYYYYTCLNIDSKQKEKSLKIIFEKVNLLSYKYYSIFLNDKEKTIGKLFLLDKKLNLYHYQTDRVKFICKNIKDNYFGIIGIGNEKFLNEDMFLREDVLILYENLKNNGFNIKYEPYSNCKMDKIFKITNTNVEKNKILFHGTSTDNVNSILKRGFSLTHKITNGNVYGPGIYFTNDINFSLKYSKENTITDEKYVIICEVFMNNICLANRNQDMFPMIGKSNIYYDTGVDNLSNPKQFIKKDVSHINILGYFVINKHISKNKISINPPFKYYSSLKELEQIYKLDVPVMLTNEAKLFINKYCKQNVIKYTTKKEFINNINMYIKENKLYNPLNIMHIIPDKHLKTILKRFPNDPYNHVDVGFTHGSLERYIIHNIMEVPKNNLINNSLSNNSLINNSVPNNILISNSLSNNSLSDKLPFDTFNYKKDKISISIQNLSKHLIQIYYKSKLYNFDIYKDKISKCKKMTNYSGLLKNSKIGINTFINEEFLCGYYDNYEFIIIKIIKVKKDEKIYYID